MKRQCCTITIRCAKCGQEKPGDQFGKGRRTCKTCQIEQVRRWQQANREHVAEQRRRYQQANPEKVAEQRRRYRQANREQINEQIRRWQQANREHVTEQKRRWEQANREHVAARVGRRRARLKNALPPDVTPAMIEAHLAGQMKRQHGLCYYCQGAFIKGHPQLQATVDHVVPIDRGGEDRPENLVWAHKKCNSAKRNKLPHEWGAGGRLL